MGVDLLCVKRGRFECVSFPAMLHPLYLLALVSTLIAADNSGLRPLLLHDSNQELLDHLGTRYEVVYPHQVRRDWARGLATTLETDAQGTILHVPETTLLIETFEYKLQLDLELNTKLFVPTLVQLIYPQQASSLPIHKLPENCYYHAKVRNHPEAKAALQTCNGIRGVIYLADKTFFIHPLHGNHSGKHPHLFYHYFPEDDFQCGNSEAVSNGDPTESGQRLEEKDDWHRNKFIEMAIVMDQSLLKKFRSPPSEAVPAALEIVNHVDLLYRPLNTSVSLVYVELWLENQMALSADDSLSDTLHRFQEYSARRIARISVDTTHLLTGIEFREKANGISFLDSICTHNAVGISLVRHLYEPHLTAFVLAHMVGHNLGMDHDHSGCECPDNGGCIMENGTPILASTSLSQCSLQAYHRTMSRGYGACLYNMPAMRVSICGNNILEEPEQCDCGTVEECLRSNPCCDPITCRLIKHAQCSSGPCCRKCKLLSPDYLCRPSKGECDIPEFCDGIHEQCPSDVFKRNGAVCSGGLGYCFQGECPVLKYQCQEIWGTGADSADSVCFERLNVQGTPNGNCGTDGRGGIIKCPQQHSWCGFLQCRSGEKSPISVEDERVQFVVHKIASQGTVHECKAKTLPTSDLAQGLVRDGTKCGYQKLCFNQTCTSLKSLVSSKCPLEDVQNTCSGHGICTNANTCFCEDGWKGEDCGTVDEDWKPDYEYDPSQNASQNPHPFAESDMRLNPNLAVTVIAASTVVGVGLVLVLMLLFFYRRP